MILTGQVTNFCCRYTHHDAGFYQTEQQRAIQKHEQ
jgi:hypothetical protein